MVVSIVFEWPIYDFGCVEGKISIARIGANISNYIRHRLVLLVGLHTNNEKFLVRIQRFLARVEVIFIGRMILNDIAKLINTIEAFLFCVKCG